MSSPLAIHRPNPDALRPVAPASSSGRSGGGFAGLALIDLLSRDGFFAAQARADESDRDLNPLARPAFALPGQGEARRLPVHERRPRARSTRSTPSPRSRSSTARPTRATTPVGSNGRPVGHLMKSPFPFARHGESGLEISSLFPHTARFADDLCVIRSMYTDTAAHASGCLQMNTGSVLIGKPSLGSWLSYGLGTREPRTCPASS